MKDPNPFDVQKPIQERVNRARSRLKLSLSIVFGSSAVALLALLALQGCKREEPFISPPPLVAQDTNPPVAPALAEPTNPPPATTSNPPVAAVPGPGVLPPVAPPVAPSNPPPAEVTSEVRQHAVEKGDSFYSLAKKYGVSMKAIQAANPGVDSKKLKIGQKLNIPGAAAAAAPAAATGATAGAASDTGEAGYVVKSGDTLARIARRHGTSVNALKAANNLATDRIKVGEKLKVPAKAAAAAADTSTTAPAPTAPPAVPPGR